MTEGTTQSLEEQNEQRLQALSEVGVSIEPLMLLKARLDMVTDIVIDATQFPQNKLEAVWQIYLSQLLDLVEETQGEEDGSSD